MADLAVKDWVFNPSLQYQFVRIHGRDSEGEQIDISGQVSEIQGNKLELKRIKGAEVVISRFYLFEFDEGLELIVYEENPTAYSLPGAYSEFDDEGE